MVEATAAKASCEFVPLESSSSPQKDVNSPVAEIAIRNVLIFSDNFNCDEAMFLLLR